MAGASLLSRLAGVFRRPKPAPLALETVPLSRLSASGTMIASGQIMGYETAADLTEVGAWAAKAREMTRQDSRAAALDLIFRHMVKSASWKATPSSDRRNARRNADFINAALGWDGHPGKMDRPWESILGSIAHYAGVGFWVVERRYKYEGGRYWLRDLYDLEPESIEGWVTDRDGELSFIKQRSWAMGEPTPKPLPAEKALVFSFNMTGRNWEGCGLLRPCLVWYDLRGILIDALGGGAQRWGRPTPLVTVDRSQDAASMYTPAQLNQMIQDTAAQADAFQSGNTGHLRETPVTKLGIYGAGQLDFIPSLIEAIKHCSLEMAQAYLNLTIDLGTATVGSFALGQVNYDASLALYAEGLDGIQTVIDGRCRPGGGLVDQMLKLNFYGDSDIPEDEFPIISHSGISKDALAEALPQLPNLTAAGLVHADLPLENRIRSLIGAPRFEPPAVETAAAIGGAP